MSRPSSPEDFVQLDVPDPAEIAQYHSQFDTFIPRMSTLDKEQAQKAADDLAAVVDDALGTTKEALHEIVDASKKAGAEGYEALHGHYESPKQDSAGGVLDSSKQFLADVYGTTTEIAGSAVNKAAELGHAAAETTGAAVSATSEQIGDFYEGTKQVASDAYEGTKQAADNAYEKVTGFGSDVGHATSEKVSDATAKASELGHDAYNATSETLSNVAHGTADTLGHAANVTKDVVADAYDATKQAAGNAVETVQDQVHAAGDAAADAGTYIKESAAVSSDYVTSSVGDAVEATKEAGHDASEKIHDFTEHAIGNAERSAAHTADALDDLHTHAKADLSNVTDTVADKAHDFVDLTTESVEHGAGNAERSAAHTADALNQLATEFQGYVDTEINTDASPKRSPSPPGFDDQDLVASAPIQSTSPTTAPARKDDEPTGHSPSPPPAHPPVINDEPDEIIDNVQETLPEPIIAAPPEASRQEIEDHVGQAVHHTTDAVDDIIKNLGQRQEEPEVPEHNSPSGDSGRDTLGGLIDDYVPNRGIPNSDSLTGMRDVSPDEEMYHRRGPVTIPFEVQQQQQEIQNQHQQQASAPEEPEVEDVPTSPSGLDSLPPRPPTPPKDLSDEAVQPPAIDLGPPSHSHEKIPGSTSGILKHYSDVAPWFDFQTVDPAVLDVVYWRDPKKSGAILGAILVALLLISKFSLLSLVAYLSLAALVGTLGYRIYNIVLARLNKSDGANPFTPYLAHELDVPQEKVHAQVDVLLENGKAAAEQLKKLFLVEKVCDSVKFGLLLWTLTYVGAWFSGLGLVTLFVIGVFSIPKVYEIYKEPIDANLAVVKEQLDKVHAIVAEKAPFLACGSTAAPAKKEE